MENSKAMQRYSLLPTPYSLLPTPINPRRKYLSPLRTAINDK
ncbi:hypothetical protein [Moorena sp. SIO1G6]|nr:hypothetical protein [Moorena sp. SIO1G6]